MMTQLFIGKRQPSPEHIEPIAEGIFHTKPKGGLWTSTWNNEDGSSGWIEWLKVSDYRDPYSYEWWLLTPDEEARIYTIDTLQDLKRLVRLYPLPNTMGYSQVDFERVAQDYDAIHLTEDGQEATHLTFPENLYGWDCESTLWLHWCFTDARQIDTPHDAGK